MTYVIFTPGFIAEEEKYQINEDVTKNIRMSDGRMLNSKEKSATEENW